jgi:uncharacterized protein with von Willebrand factor type A (vWA) domain
LEVGPGRISDALTGLDCLDIRNRDDVYWALRTTHLSRAEELESFDRAFAAWFLRSPSRPPYRGTLPVDKPPRLSERTRTDRTGNDDGHGDEATEIGWSSHEVLRRKDFDAMTPEEFAQLSKEITDVAASRPLRRSRRCL